MLRVIGPRREIFSGERVADEPALVRLTRIGKRFGGVVACADIDFVVHPGEVQALLGENGAGK